MGERDRHQGKDEGLPSRRAAQPALTRRACLAALSTGLVSFCGDSAPLAALRPAAARGDHPPVLVLVILDGVRHQDVLGLDSVAPELAHLAHAEGCHLGGLAAPLLASGPDYLSLPGYAEILTGSSRAGCVDNGCEAVAARTLLEDFAAADATGAGVALVASWPELGRIATQGRAVGAVSVGRSGGYNHVVFRRLRASRRAFLKGRRAAGPGVGDYRSDVATADLALAFLPEARPRLLVVSLGDADEHAHRGALDGYRNALFQADVFVGRVHRQLRDLESVGIPTALLVTTDHGRADHLVDHGAAWPESAHCWLVAAGGLIGARGRLAPPTARSLSDLAPTLRFLGGLDPGEPEGNVLWELVPRAAELARAL